MFDIIRNLLVIAMVLCICIANKRCKRKAATVEAKAPANTHDMLHLANKCDSVNAIINTHRMKKNSYDSSHIEWVYFGEKTPWKFIHHKKDRDDTYVVEFCDDEVLRVFNERTGEPFMCSKEKSMKELVAHFSKSLSDNVEQIMQIEKDLIEAGGETSIYGQIFNNSYDLSSREMTALVTALEEDGYIVTKSDYKTGEISLRLS